MDAQLRDDGHSRFPLGFKDAIGAFFSPRLRISKESILAHSDYRLDRQTLEDRAADQQEKAGASAISE